MVCFITSQRTRRWSSEFGSLCPNRCTKYDSDTLPMEQYTTQARHCRSRIQLGSCLWPHAEIEVEVARIPPAEKVGERSQSIRNLEEFMQRMRWAGCSVKSKRHHAVNVKRYRQVGNIFATLSDGRGFCAFRSLIQSSGISLTISNGTAFCPRWRSRSSRRHWSVSERRRGEKGPQGGKACGSNFTIVIYHGRYGQDKGLLT